ncbi:alpha/beta fold hydrolase [Paraconexibacter sp. AEG42_29]
MPDVFGAVLPANGVPDASQLSPPARVLYEGTVVFDLALRTGLASVLAGAMLPGVVTQDQRRERRRLDFYRELAAGKDAGAVFAPPDGGIAVKADRRARSLPRLAGGHAELLRFRSPFVPLQPELRGPYAKSVPNRTAWAQHWRHDDGPRPTLCVIHGFGASPDWFNKVFFELGWFFRQGYDVLLYTLPFHGRRRSRFAPVNGAELFSHGFAQFNEAMIHAVHDFRAFVDYLEGTGVDRVGVTGLSLGGYTSALLAAVEPRLDFVIPNAPVTYIPQILAEWFPVNAMVGAVSRTRLVDIEHVTASIAVHSPLNYAPVVPKERRMIIGGLGDRLAPPEQARLLWEHWDRPKLRWFPGSHILHVGRGTYLREMRDLMAAPPLAA